MSMRGIVKASSKDFEQGFAKMRSGAPGKMFLYP